MPVLLVRHASSAGQSPDAALSEAGQMQAEALVQTLQPLGITALFSSPYARAQATIAPFAAQTSQEVTILEDLAERRLAPEPLPDWRDHIARSFVDHAYCVPGGESLLDVRHRAERAMAQIMQDGGQCPVVVVHGQWLAALLTGLDPLFGEAEWAALKNPDFIWIDAENGRRTVRQMEP